MKADIEWMAMHSGIIAHVPVDQAELIAFAKLIADDVIKMIRSYADHHASAVVHHAKTFPAQEFHRSKVSAGEEIIGAIRARYANYE